MNHILIILFPAADLRMDPKEKPKKERGVTNPGHVPDENSANGPANILMDDLGYYNPKAQDTLMNPLHMDKFKSWYDILKTDNLRAYDTRMKCSKPERLSLLNKKFLYCTPYSKKLKNLRKDNTMLEFETPLCVAAASASRRVFVRMIKDGANVLKTDIEGCNVIHALVRACGQSENAEYMYMEILRAILAVFDIATLKKLLFHEDVNGFRPLEAAAKYGTFGLFRMILETREVYYEVIDEVGMCTYGDYDIDDYESGFCRKRELRSPLRFIRMLNPKGLKSFDDNKIHEHPVVKNWIRRKFIRAIPWMIIWFCLRILFLVSHVLYDPQLMMNRNLDCTSDPDHIGCGKSGGPPIDFMRVFSDMSVYISWMIIGFDIIDFLFYIFEKDRWKLHGGFLHVFNKYVSYTVFYRVIQLSLAFVSLINFYFTQKSDPDSINMVKAISLPLILMAFMYMVELSPILGIFAITLQKMTTTMLKFGFVTVFIWLIYAYFFMISTNDSNFDGIGMSIYSLFLIETGNFSFTKISNFIMVAHITYFYLCGILLLNYLIAIMATLSDEVNKQKYLCLTLRRLDIAILIDDRFGRWFRRLWYMCSKNRKRIRIAVKNPQRFKRIKLNVQLDGEQSVML
jgi:hypothetical protein